MLGVQGLAEVLAAVRRCASSACLQRVSSYRAHLGLPAPTEIPVLVESLVAADQAGVLFTRESRSGEDDLVINASWGLGESVVSGAVVPDEVIVAPDGTVSRLTIGAKQIRVDAGADGLVASVVAKPDRARACLTPRQIAELAELGRRCEHLFRCPQDVEWAIHDGRVWVLQSRPITSVTPSVARDKRQRAGTEVVLTGVPASPGRAEGPTRLVRSVDEFSRVRPGDVLVCRTTDPVWTPLFRLVASIVTETGGALCHAAIVAREYGLPAVSGAADAMSQLPDGQLVVEGSLGTVTTATRPERHP